MLACFLLPVPVQDIPPVKPDYTIDCPENIETLQFYIYKIASHQIPKEVSRTHVAGFCRWLTCCQSTAQLS